METATILFIILGSIIILAIYVFQGKRHESLIHEKVDALGGTVELIERRNFFTGIGPFNIVGKGRRVYRIEYRLDGETKEAWVRFGSIFGPDWRL